MRIERLDGGDAPPRPGDGGGPAADQPAVPPETRDRHTYYTEYRATVEAEYRAARHSWDAAVPSLRAAWAAHERQFPASERTGPSPQPDVPGAWRGDGGRYLAPDANAEISKGCERIHEIGKKNIVTPIREIEAEDPGRHLAGFKFRLKDPDRIKEKVADRLSLQPELTPSQALSAVPDAVRFTFVYREEGYASGVRADIQRLKAAGFEAQPLKNSWSSDQYKGINTQWREPQTGQLFEVQFHTRASFEAKQLTHKSYERIRNPQTSEDERTELEAFQRKVTAKIPVPQGAAEITDIPREPRDG